MFYGIDVSNVNGHVAWGRVASAGTHFAWAKVTEGVSYRDPLFEENRSGAHAFGIPVGGYHFGRPDHHPGTVGARAEADAFVRALGSVMTGELRPVLDLEVGSGSLTAWAGAFLAEVEARLGVRPLLYTYSAFAVAHLSLKALAGYGLWIADYGRNDGSEHPAALPHVAHQFTSNGSVPGVIGRVDRNRADSLAPLLASAVIPTPSTPKDEAPKPEPKNDSPFTRKLWPVPVPKWFWDWAEWRLGGKQTPRPEDAPRVIPAWAWIRLRAL